MGKFDLSESYVLEYRGVSICMTGDISIGSTVRYAGTGSVGEVMRLEERDHELWARLGSTGLWYAAAELEVLGAEFEGKGWGKNARLKRRKRGRKLTLEELTKAEERKMECTRQVQEITCSISAGVFG